MSRVPRGSMPGPVLLNCLMKELAEGAECTFSRFADNTKLGGEAEAPEGHSAVQRVLGSWRKGLAGISCSSRRARPSGAPGEEQAQAPGHAGGTRLGSSRAGKTLGVLGDTNLPMSYYGKGGQHCPGLH